MADIFDTTIDNVDIEVTDNKIEAGEEVNLTAKDHALNNLLIGVGWDLNAFDSDSLDLDVSCFLLDKNGQTRMNEDFVFYNNMESLDKGVIHNGDNRTGAGDGDDESISIDLQNIPFDISTIMFVISIYRGDEHEQGLERIRNGYIRVVNATNGFELLRFETKDVVQERKETAMLVGALQRRGPKWHFEAIGEPVEGGLGTIATNYGMVIYQG